MSVIPPLRRREDEGEGTCSDIPCSHSVYVCVYVCVCVCVCVCVVQQTRMLQPRV